MKIFITGGSGKLGYNLINNLKRSYEILAGYFRNKIENPECETVNIDLCDVRGVEKLLNEFRPDVIIHTASISDPAKADNVPSKGVYDVNVKATENLAVISKKIGSRIIYTSTDLVYAGNRGSMLSEDAKLIPISLYAETKLMGEVKIRKILDNYLILRTALLFGLGTQYEGNHFNEIYRKLSSDQEVGLFADQFRTPISFSEASRIISKLIEKDISGEVINLGGSDRVSRFDMGIMLCTEAKLKSSLLVRKKMDDVKGFYKVEDVSMNTSKLNSLGINQLNIQESIHNELKRIKDF